jgi:hypothetical protein
VLYKLEKNTLRFITLNKYAKFEGKFIDDIIICDRFQDICVGTFLYMFKLAEKHFDIKWHAASQTYSQKD